MKKIKECIVLLMIVNSLEATSQVPSWIWAEKAGGSEEDNCHGIAIDVAGNVLVTGYFMSSSITFGSYTFNNSSAGMGDIFVVKYDSAGNVLWARSATGPGFDAGHSIATDADGNVFITGNYQGPSSIIFGNDTLINTVGSSSPFIVKYDYSGNVIWARGAGGPGIGSGTSISVDTSGNVLVAGTFFSSYITFSNDTLPIASSDNDIFVVKYDASGNELWARRAGGTNKDYLNASTSDAAGNVIITGYFASDSITFGSYTLTNSTSTSASAYVVKYDASGNVVWANSAGQYSESGFDVTTDATGNVLVSGEFWGDSIVFGNYTLYNTNAGYYDIFIVKYDTSGNVLWAKSEGAMYYEDAKSIAIDASDNVFIAGYYDSPSVTFGSYTLNNTSPGYEDIFVVKYDSSGNVAWAAGVGGQNNDYARNMGLDADGNVYITGGYQSAFINFGGTMLTNAGILDAFTAKLSVVPTGIAETVYPAGSVTVSPNPSANSTTISFLVEKTEKVSLKIFDVNGKIISTLADKIFEPGKHSIKWNAEKTDAGIYLLRMEAGDYLQTIKISVIK